MQAREASARYCYYLDLLICYQKVLRSGGGGVVGNKGNITARGVVGNKGNTTVGQSKVNAAGKRKNFKGNIVRGPSKRRAGILGGLIRRAKRALVVQKRGRDKILDDEELRRAGKAILFWTEQEPEHQALQRTDGGASQLAVAVHAGEASVQRVLETRKLLQQVWDLGCYPQESRCGGVERLLARMPRRLAPPLCDPVWRDGQMLYVDNAFDPRGLSERVLKVTSCSRIKAQHAYKDLGRGVGSFNFGVVPSHTFCKLTDYNARASASVMRKQPHSP